jgi:hypothetical protein
MEPAHRHERIAEEKATYRVMSRCRRCDFCAAVEGELDELIELIELIEALS